MWCQSFQSRLVALTCTLLFFFFASASPTLASDSCADTSSIPDFPSKCKISSDCLRLDCSAHVDVIGKIGFALDLDICNRDDSLNSVEASIETSAGNIPAKTLRVGDSFDLAQGAASVGGLGGVKVPLKLKALGFSPQHNDQLFMTLKLQVCENAVVYKHCDTVFKVDTPFPITKTEACPTPKSGFVESLGDMPVLYAVIGGSVMVIVIIVLVSYLCCCNGNRRHHQAGYTMVPVHELGTGSIQQPAGGQVV